MYGELLQLCNKELKLESNVFCFGFLETIILHTEKKKKKKKKEEKKKEKKKKKKKKKNSIKIN